MQNISNETFNTEAAEKEIRFEDIHETVQNNQTID
jgi:hypothetical protein